MFVFSKLLSSFKKKFMEAEKKGFAQMFSGYDPGKQEAFREGFQDEVGSGKGKMERIKRKGKKRKDKRGREK